MGSHIAVLRELSDLAARELVIEQALSNISTAFANLKLSFVPETESGINGGSLMAAGFFHASRPCTSVHPLPSVLLLYYY